MAGLARAWGDLSSPSSGNRLRTESEIGGVESALADGCNEVTRLHTAMRGHILLAASVDIRLAHLALQTLAHQPKEDGTTVLTVGRKHV